MNEELVSAVKDRYASAARAVRLGLIDLSAQGCCTPSAAHQDLVEQGFGSGLYDDTEGIPNGAVVASLGCGNPTAVAELRTGDRVLDLGSGGGLDALIAARRVGPTGQVYGVDMTDEMLELARANARAAGALNVEFRKGTIENLPLPDGCVDVVISNCVINLSVDKPAVFAEIHRVLAAGGRIGITDVVAEDQLTPAERAERGSYTGCIAGALSRQEYLDGLTGAGFENVTIEYTHEPVPGMHSTIITATRS
ncbi:MAG: arsenite methyltransferase [Propionicimonas sp.]